MLKANFEMWIYLFEFILEIFEDKKLDPGHANKILEVSEKNDDEKKNEDEEKGKKDLHQQEKKEHKSKKNKKEKS